MAVLLLSAILTPRNRKITRGAVRPRGDILGLNASGWAMQFSAWFPMKGALSQQHSHRAEKPNRAFLLGGESLLSVETERFVSRARRAPVRLASSL